MRLLMVEDDQVFAAHVRRRLADDGIAVDHATTVGEGLARARSGAYAGVLLDIDLPDGSGLAVLRQLRAGNHAIPVMIVSGNASEETIVHLLEAGADDYVTKPVTLRLLRARIRALLRRGGAVQGDSTRVGALVVDHRQRAAWVSGRMLDLTVLEFDLLACLAQHAGVPQTRADLLEAVWKVRDASQSNVVDVTVGRLRRKLHAEAVVGEAMPEIEAVRGIGYVLRTPEQLRSRMTRGA
jgi:DNA-binding response OmpR family regulator